MPSATVSVCIITYNEEKNIRACLESVRWADEIIVVDSFSNDATVSICSEYTHNVMQRSWPGHVEQKNFAIDQATGDWILGLDADERVSPELAEEIKAVLAGHDQGADGFSFPRHSFYLGRWINHGGWYPDAKIRLFKRGLARWGGKNPHDKVILGGKVGYLHGELRHYVYRNISHQLQTVDSFSSITADGFFSEGKRFNLGYLVFRPCFKFLETYVWRRGFLDGLPGFVIAVISSYYVFLKYAKLWEKEKGL
ncbi:MAG TPA: glycosyltransferase family 2 protein [Thermodesulfobacteriota bacterium]|nr:glycosyltransferase family 2 protein [Thermodesulfobacteriota bacterium]HQO78280.1 glycosyltransferase family 2 protein [Thermodesulfobacteriota bacterium]